MRKFTADYVFTLEGEVLPNGLVITDDSGKILSVSPSYYKEDKEIERFDGIITPGFINAHCHLELSHLLGKVKEGEGLISFIKDVVSLRNADDNEVIEAMQNADKAMYDNGIVAVGDISNTAISAKIKDKSPIKYHTFVEMVGIDPDKADELIEHALKLKKSFGEQSSITPHAPYTLSKQLLKKVRKYCKSTYNLLSIHNQESDEENKLYRYKSGKFIDLYTDLGISIDRFISMSKNTIQAVVPLLPENQRVLMVHNTYTNVKDIYFVRRFSRQIFWCFCPSSNIYIENTLPNLRLFRKDENLVCLGTDSLASNHSLSILDEMKLISKEDKNVTFNDLIEWATINGAKFLGFEDELGSIKVGKRPGLNLITNFKDGELSEESSVKKLI